MTVSRRIEVAVSGREAATDPVSPANRDFDAFTRDAAPRLRRALVARYGVDVGVEATADAMAYAWERWNEVAAMANPAGYLWRVGQTSARRHRRWQRTPHLPLEVVAEGTTTEPGLPAALQRLRPDERVAVVLVHGYAWSYAEVAALLGVPVTTIRNHVHRGMHRLRRALES